jgi:crotonyl-CoA carboxylase/reductase
VNKNLYELGETPPLGHVPDKMYASVIRSERYGQPRDAFQIEVVDVPKPGPRQVLVWVMAAGINYNNVWAALGTPVDVIAARRKANPAEPPFHIGGSDASGIVWAVGSEVKSVAVGDEVVLSCATWDENAADIQAGADPITSTSTRIWGYEENWGSFAQFTRVDDYQCHPKPPKLSWEAAAAYMLVGATAYRQLMGWAPNIVKEGDPVLIWGGSGGLGSMAIQIVKAKGGIPIAVVSSESRMEHCYKLGAKGVINRTDPAFTHWGRLPDTSDTEGYAEWMKGANAFRKKWSEVLGSRQGPRIVLEHPGESTIPTSVLVCETGGMVVVCAGTTGFAAQADLRYLWMRQKRLQGSHFANDKQSAEYNQLVLDQKVDPCHSETFSFDDIPRAHQLMHENKHAPGNMSCLVNAKE